MNSLHHILWSANGCLKWKGSKLTEREEKKFQDCAHWVCQSVLTHSCALKRDSLSRWYQVAPSLLTPHVSGQISSLYKSKDVICSLPSWDLKNQDWSCLSLMLSAVIEILQAEFSWHLWWWKCKAEWNPALSPRAVSTLMSWSHEGTLLGWFFLFAF